MQSCSNGHQIEQDGLDFMIIENVCSRYFNLQFFLLRLKSSSLLFALPSSLCPAHEGDVH